MDGFKQLRVPWLAQKYGFKYFFFSQPFDGYKPLLWLDGAHVTPVAANQLIAEGMLHLITGCRLGGKTAIAPVGGFLRPLILDSELERIVAAVEVSRLLAIALGS